MNPKELAITALVDDSPVVVHVEKDFKGDFYRGLETITIRAQIRCGSNELRWNSEASFPPELTEYVRSRRVYAGREPLFPFAQGTS